MSGTLNTADYQTVWDDNFTQDKSVNSSLFPIRWGDASEFSFGSGGLTLTSDGTAAGFLTPVGSASGSYGYGLYQATFTMPTNQAAGAYICLWPATDNWPGPEIDLTEQLNGQSYLTVHWAGSGDSNQYQSFVFNANVSQPTTVAVDWEANSLGFYVNGQEVVKYSSGGSVPVPKDYADGGQNEAFGIGNVGPAGTSLTVSDMSYSAYTGSGSSSGSSSNSESSSNSGSSGGGSAGATTSSAITQQTTSVGGAAFLSTGTSSGLDNQTLYTAPGTDILKGNGGIDTFYVDATSSDGWAEIDNFHGGDVLNILGFNQWKSTITWTTATDPNGQSGATAQISLNGNGHIDSSVTLAGVDLATAQGLTQGNWHTSSGTPYLSMWR